MLQLVRQVFKDPEDKTDLFLIFANQVGKYTLMTSPSGFSSTPV